MTRKELTDAEGVWVLRAGMAHKALPRPKAVGRREDVDYNNPYRYKIERVWWDGKIVFATEQGELDVDPKKVKVAQEYQIVYSVSLSSRGQWVRGTRPKRVPGQLNIYDTVPGMRGYSPIWQFNYVIVPRGYKANTLRSEKDCLASAYPIKKSRIFEN